MYHPTADITIRYHVVDELPHGQAVAVRDDSGHIDAYLSRAHSIDRIAGDLGWVFTALAQCDYERHATAS